MGLCMGIVKCRPWVLVTTAWLVPRCRKVRPYARATVLMWSGVQSARGLALIDSSSLSVLDMSYDTTNSIMVMQGEIDRGQAVPAPWSGGRLSVRCPPACRADPVPRLLAFDAFDAAGR